MHPSVHRALPVRRRAWREPVLRGPPRRRTHPGAGRARVVAGVRVLLRPREPHPPRPRPADGVARARLARPAGARQGHAGSAGRRPPRSRPRRLRRVCARARRDRLRRMAHPRDAAEPAAGRRPRPQLHPGLLPDACLRDSLAAVRRLLVRPRRGRVGAASGRLRPRSGWTPFSSEASSSTSALPTRFGAQSAAPASSSRA